MSHAYRQLEEGQRLEADSSLVKTYLLEAHANRAEHDSTFELLRASFSPEQLGARARSEVTETQEEFFFVVNAHYGRDSAMFYVDTSDSRNWFVHTTSRSTESDRIIQRLILQNAKLDGVWLPMQMLEHVAALGSFRGLGLDFDRREVPDIDFTQPDSPPESLKMQLWGNRAGEILRLLRREGAFPESTTLSKVKVKHWLDQADEDHFSVDDVKFDGKITARGTSFQSHINLVSSVSRSYAAKIRTCETEFSLNFEDRGGRTIPVGEPLAIKFGRPIGNLERFIDRLFSAAFPFRLAGVPTKLNDEFYRVIGVDLHVSQRLTFEITPSFIRLFLPKGTCGNTVARLYTNLQHYYDSQVELISGSGELIF